MSETSDACVFCKIISGQIPGSFVAKTESTSSFLDLHPINDGHLLVVPHRHVELFTDLTDVEAGELFSTGRRILAAMKTSGLKCEGGNLFLSDGTVAGQEVGHCHLHVVPRYTGDGQRIGFRRAGQSPRHTLDRIAESIRQSLGVGPVV